MILPFVKLYTSGVNDVEYIRPIFAFTITIAGVLTCYRIPYQTVITSIGHYKQTRNGAFAEAFINIFISIILVIHFGLIGVAVGTLVAAAFRTLQYANYVNKKILLCSNKDFYVHLIVGLFELLLISGIFQLIDPNIQSVLDWIYNAALISLISLTITIIPNLILFRKEFLTLIQKFTALIYR